MDGPKAAAGISETTTPVKPVTVRSAVRLVPPTVKFTEVLAVPCVVAPRFRLVVLVLSAGGGGFRKQIPLGYAVALGMPTTVRTPVVVIVTRFPAISVE